MDASNDPHLSFSEQELQDSIQALSRWQASVEGNFSVPQSQLPDIKQDPDYDHDGSHDSSKAHSTSELLCRISSVLDDVKKGTRESMNQENARASSSSQRLSKLRQDNVSNVSTEIHNHSKRPSSSKANLAGLSDSKLFEMISVSSADPNPKSGSLFSISNTKPNLREIKRSGDSDSGVSSISTHGRVTDNQLRTSKNRSRGLSAQSLGSLAMSLGELDKNEQKSVDQFRSQTKQATQIALSLAEEVKNLRAERAELCNVLAEMKQRLQECASKLFSNEQAYKKEVGVIREQLYTSENQRMAVSKENDLLLAKNKQLHSSLQSQEGSLAELRTMLQNLKESFTLAKNELEEKRLESEQLYATNVLLEGQCSELRNQLMELTKRYQESNSKVSPLASELANLHSAFEGARADWEQSHKLLTTKHQAEVGHLQSKVLSLTMDLSNLRSSFQDAKGEHEESAGLAQSKYQAEISQLQSKVSSLTLELNNMFSSFQEARSNWEQSNTEMQSKHQTEISQLQSKVSSLGSELKHTRSTLENERSSWEQSIELCQSKHQVEVKQLQSKISSLTSELNDLLARFDEATSRWKQTSQETERHHQSEVAGLESKLSNTAEELAHLQSLHQEARIEWESNARIVDSNHQAEVAQLNSKVAILEAESKHIKREYSRAKDGWQKAESTVKAAALSDQTGLLSKLKDVKSQLDKQEQLNTLYKESVKKLKKKLKDCLFENKRLECQMTEIRKQWSSSETEMRKQFNELATKTIQEHAPQVPVFREHRKQSHVYSNRSSPESQSTSSSYKHRRRSRLKHSPHPADHHSPTTRGQDTPGMTNPVQIYTSNYPAPAYSVQPPAPGIPYIISQPPPVHTEKTTLLPTQLTDLSRIQQDLQTVKHYLEKSPTQHGHGTAYRRSTEEQFDHRALLEHQQKMDRKLSAVLSSASKKVKDKDNKIEASKLETEYIWQKLLEAVK